MRAGHHALRIHVNPGTDASFLMHASPIDADLAGRLFVRFWLWADSAAFAPYLQFVYVHTAKTDIFLEVAGGSLPSGGIDVSIDEIRAASHRIGCYDIRP